MPAHLRRPGGYRERPLRAARGSRLRRRGTSLRSAPAAPGRGSGVFDVDDVALGRRLVLEADLLAPDRDGLLDVLDDRVLAQADALARAGGLDAESDLLLGAHHLGLGALVAGEDARRLAVVLGEPVLVVLAERHVGVDLGRRADLLERVGQLDLVVHLARTRERDQPFLTPQQAALHAGVGRAITLVEVEGAELAHLLAVAIDDGLPAPRQDGVEFSHAFGLPVWAFG